MNTCERQEKKNLLVPLPPPPQWFEESQLHKKHTSLSPPPSGEKWNIHSGDRRRGREGGREGCLQIAAISQPDCLLTQRSHCSSFPLDGD